MSIDKNKILDQISSMSLVDLIELIDAIEKKFGISSSDYMFSAKAENNVSKVKEQKNEFDLYLNSIGPNKIAIIKIVRSYLNLGLKEAKDLVESAPVLIKDKIDKKNLDILKKSLQDSGAVVDVK